MNAGLLLLSCAALCLPAVRRLHPPRDPSVHRTLSADSPRPSAFSPPVRIEHLVHVSPRCSMHPTPSSTAPRRSCPSPAVLRGCCSSSTAHFSTSRWRANAPVTILHGKLVVISCAPAEWPAAHPQVTHASYFERSPPEGGAEPDDDEEEDGGELVLSFWGAMSWMSALLSLFTAHWDQHQSASPSGLLITWLPFPRTAVITVAIAHLSNFAVEAIDGAANAWNLPIAFISARLRLLAILRAPFASPLASALARLLCSIDAPRAGRQPLMSRDR